MQDITENSKALGQLGNRHSENVSLLAFLWMIYGRHTH